MDMDVDHTEDEVIPGLPLPLLIIIITVGYLDTVGKRTLRRWFDESDDPNAGRFVVGLDERHLSALPNWVFQHWFRLDKVTFKRVLRKVEPLYLGDNPTGRPLSVSPAKALLMLLNYLSGSGFHWTNARDFGVSETTAWRCVIRCRDALILLAPQVITFPRTGREMQQVDDKFYDFCGLRGCCGIVDGTHIPCKVGALEKYVFANRKGSITTTMLCFVDTDLRFLSVHIGVPGSQHDSRIFRQSQIVRDQLNKPPSDKPIPPGKWIAADEAFPLCDWVVTPFPVETPREMAFNKAFSRGRLSVERCLGKFKSQWRLLLKADNDHYHTVRWTLAACILHNETVADRHLYDDWNEWEPDPMLHMFDDWNIVDTVDDGFGDYILATDAARRRGRDLRSILRDKFCEENPDRVV